MIKLKPTFAGFGKPGEKVEEKDGAYILTGKGTDIGCNLILNEKIERPSMLELEIRGKIKKEAPWARLRIEVFDEEKPAEPSTSFENDYLTVELDPKEFRHLTLPVLGIVKAPQKIQFMVVGPAESHLEMKNVTIR